MNGTRVVVEPCRKGPGSRGDFRRESRGGGRDDYRGRGPPPRKSTRYGPPVQTRYRLSVENLSTRCSWQVRIFPQISRRKPNNRILKMSFTTFSK